MCKKSANITANILEHVTWIKDKIDKTLNLIFSPQLSKLEHENLLKDVDNLLLKVNNTLDTIHKDYNKER